MVRKKLAVAVAAIGVLQANVANALGVGEFSLFSALNQPLEAEIRLQNTGDLDNNQVIIKLAEPEDFSNAGISRDFFLTNINFKVELDSQGNGIIKVTTREPVVEPYLNFLIETRWPSGRLLREYTVLLDLPVFSESDVEPVQAATSSMSQQTDTPPPAAATAASVPVVTHSRPASSASTPRKTLEQGELSPGEKYRVRNQDTLWEIALKSRPAEGVSVQQTMVVIQRLNPQAFINGNINRLKAGSVLRLPTQDDISVSEKQAVGEVANQNRSWRSGDDTVAPSSDAQLDATAAGSSENTYSEQPRLSIAASGDSDVSSTGEGEGTDSSDSVDSTNSASVALQNELAASEESLDKIERDNQELKTRLENMEARMATLQRLLELKESQLADLQDSAAAAAPVAAKPEPKPQPKPQPKPKSSPVDQVLDNPLYVGGAAALLLAAIAIVLLRRRKEAAAADEDFTTGYVEEDVKEGIEEEADTLADVAMDETVTDTVAEIEGVDETDNLIAELEQQIAADNAKEAAMAAADDAEESLIEGVEPLDNAAPVESAAEVPSETGDAMAEADIYVAYGRFQQAIDLLRSAIDQKPERSDLQLKLLEVYIETRDKPGFQQQYLALKALGDDAATGEAKEILSSVEGVADWLDDLPGNSNNFTDEDMDAEIALDDLDLDFDEDNSDDFVEATTVQLDAAELEDTPTKADSSSPLDLPEEPELSDSLGDSLGDSEAFDLDLESLADTDLSELEAEFGDAAPATESSATETFGADVATDADADDFDFLADTDEIATKLDLARAYIDMGDAEGARDILDEVMQEGSAVQKQEAQALSERID